MAGMPISSWMSWEGGVDLVASTVPGSPLPNLIVHVARMVHTPVGSAPSGMVLWQPDPKGPPLVVGFVSSDPKLAAWFGPHAFAGTPFEKAPALVGRIDTQLAGDRATSRVEVAGHRFEVTMHGLAAAELVQRAAGQPMPFAQHGLEAKATRVEVAIDGVPLVVHVPAVAMTGGPGALASAAGLYAR